MIKYREECAFPVIDLQAWRQGSGLANLFHLVRGLARLYSLMRREHFQVIEAFTHHANLLGLPVAWLAGVPVRVAVHQGRIEKLPGWLLRLHTWLVNSKMVSCLVAVSSRLQAYAIEIEGIAPEKIVMIPNGHSLGAPVKVTGDDRRPVLQGIGHGS